MISSRDRVKTLKKSYTRAMNKIILSLYIGIVVILPMSAHAGPILRTGEKLSVDSAQVLKGDFYGFSPTVTISGKAENDVYIGGGTVTINAPVTEDLTIIGGVVQIHGEVGDDVRIVGGEVTLGKVVKGDVVVLGGSLTILSTATIEGDVLFMGGDLTIEGNVIGSIHGTSENVRINAEVGGDILYSVSKSFTVGDNAVISGNIMYEGFTDIVRAQGANIIGEIHKTEMLTNTGNVFFKVIVFQICVLIFGAFALYLMCRSYVQVGIEKTEGTLSTLGLIGLGTFLIVPFVSTILMVSVVGLLIGILLFLLFGFMVLLAVISSPIMVGYYVQKVLTKNRTIRFSTILMGVIVFCLLGVIPYVGGLLIIACVFIMLGVISTSLYHFLRS